MLNHLPQAESNSFVLRSQQLSNPFLLLNWALFGFMIPQSLAFLFSHFESIHLNKGNSSIYISQWWVHPPRYGYKTVTFILTKRRILLFGWLVGFVLFFTFSLLVHRDLVREAHSQLAFMRISEYPHELSLASRKIPHSSMLPALGSLSGCFFSFPLHFWV